MKASGTYSIPITGGSTSASSATVKHFKGDTAFGASDICRISGGKLELNSNVITSDLGLSYWSAIPASFLVIDMLSISTALVNDPTFQNLAYEMVLEIEPEYVNGVVSQSRSSCSVIQSTARSEWPWYSSVIPQIYSMPKATV